MRCKFEVNKDKLQLRLRSVPYMGHLLMADGLKPDPSKIKAIRFMQKPSDAAGLRRYLGFVNYLLRFFPKLSTLCEPLRKLISKNAEWDWTIEHDKACEKIKHLLSQAPVLRYYNVKSLFNAIPAKMALAACSCEMDSQSPLLQKLCQRPKKGMHK